MLKQKPREAARFMARYAAEPEFIHLALSGSSNICGHPFSVINIHVRTSDFTWYVLIYWHFTRPPCLLKSTYLQLKYLLISKRRMSYAMLKVYRSFPASYYFGHISKQAITPSASTRKSLAEGTV